MSARQLNIRLAFKRYSKGEAEKRLFVSATDDDAAETDESPKKKSILVPLLLGLVLAGIGGAGGFFAVSSGVIGGGDNEQEVVEKADASLPDELDSIAFVPLDAVVIDITGPTGRQILRFRADVEVSAGYEDDVANLKPRIMDVMNGYLRAVDPAELQEPAALLRLRGQLLRRVQLVVGEGRVRDLLVIEFVLN